MGKKYKVEASVTVAIDFEYEDNGSDICIEEQIHTALEEQYGYPTFCEIAEIYVDFWPAKLPDAG